MQESAEMEIAPGDATESMQVMTFSPKRYASILLPQSSNLQLSGHFVSMNIGKGEEQRPVPQDWMQSLRQVKHTPDDSLLMRRAK